MRPTPLCCKRCRKSGIEGEADYELHYPGLPYCRPCAAILKAFLAVFHSGDPFEVRSEHVIRVPGAGCHRNHAVVEEGGHMR